MYRSKIALLILCFFLSSFSVANGESAHSFLGNSFSNSARLENIDNYKLDVARKVFDDLVEAKGVKNMPVPKFRLVKSERNVAWSNSESVEIGLEEKAYDICVSFGADSLNALAAILGHELTHYYEKHGWTEMFAADFADMKSSAELVNMDQHLPQETQADYLGGFLSYSAGYKTLEIMPAFLDKVYATYSFKETMAGYPSLGERKEMATASLKRCQDLIQVFEMANYLVALEDYDHARLYYEYILKDFQSREMYNNIGITTALAAMALFSKKELKFVFPFELDAESRLKSGNKGGQQGFGEDQERREELLKKAVDYFKTAIVLDDTYAIAYLNLANVYALLGETMDAEYNARKAIKLAKKRGTKKTITDTQVLLGILAAMENETEDAADFFDKAIEEGSALAALNKAILAEKTSPVTPASTTTGLTKPDKIGEISLDKLVIELQREELTPTLLMEIDKQTTFARLDYEHSNVFIHLLPFDEQYLFLQITSPDYPGETGKGIKIASSREEVIAAYGTADHDIQLAQGAYWVYDKRKLLFFMDEKGKVTAWAVFRRSE